MIGDRIGIMSGGVLQCWGSTHFLKRRFGAGYHLKLIKDAECNSDEVTELLREHLPNLQVDSCSLWQY